MFRTYDREKNLQVFTEKDPHEDGYIGALEAGVALDYPQDVYNHRVGEASPEVVIGLMGPRAYRVFKFERERQQAGCAPIPGGIVTCYSWADYLEGRVAAYDNSHNETGESK